MSPEQLQSKLAFLGEMLKQEFPTTRKLDDTTYAFDYAAGPIPLACYCEINPDLRGFIVRGLFQPPIAPGHRAAVSE
jgi:hypothetical protein